MNNPRFQKPLKPYFLLYLVPVISLVTVIIPFGFKYNTVYLTMCTLLVGSCAVVLALGYLLIFKVEYRKPPNALILVVVILIYNPVILRYSIIYQLEAINHQFVVFCNLCTAAIFTYLWWNTRKIK